MNINISQFIALGSVAAIVGMFNFSAVSRAQGQSIPAGDKTITLNEKVGHNQFVWESDAPLEDIKGSSEAVTGILRMNSGDITSLRGTIITQTSTMKTGNDTRDHHLKSSDWMDVSHYPTITFKIESVSNVQSSGNTSTGTATGNFTMHGVTKRISIPFRMTYVPQSPKTLSRAPGDLAMFSSEFQIGLKDFNIAGEHGMVGSKVGESIKVTAQLFGNTQ